MAATLKTLKFRWGKNERGYAVVIVENFPGLQAEMGPMELVKMARELLEAVELAPEACSQEKQSPMTVHEWRVKNGVPKP